MRRLRFSTGSRYFDESHAVTSSSGPNTDIGTRGSIGPSGRSQSTTAAIDSPMPPSSRRNEASGSETPRQATRLVPRRYSASQPAAASPPAPRKKRSESVTKPRPISRTQPIRIGHALP